MEEKQPIIWEKGDKVLIFGKWLMEVQQDVDTRHWYLQSAVYDYNIFAISNSITADFNERTSLDLDTIAKSFNGITKGRFLPEFVSIGALLLFVHRINELYDNAKEKEKCGEPKENNQKDRPIVDKLMTATNEYRVAPIPDVWKPTPTVGNFNFAPIYILPGERKQQEKTNDSTITTTKKTKNYETELQDKGTSLSRGDLSEGHQLRSRKNKARIVCGHLGDKTKDC